jgi:ribosomal protein L21
MIQDDIIQACIVYKSITRKLVYIARNKKILVYKRHPERTQLKKKNTHRAPPSTVQRLLDLRAW